ncbi:YggS family pyridoxal phosphate-dependent enzyme [Skermania sp. ID1734]|uniref:YggS family pyridoxal phosphate-dependent enzyme n=1 Tax=Skermania sp. ID1734 TaxID=2597516 RepID=UPI00117D0B7A|nr:YggS family pyridoxal phosphate-dependent enzyme [Skermania sp. ID1734]TSE01222.1 YggS family pyridoxal phosphate-dependent enzyme [Skermania sp. ID1734]
MTAGEQARESELATALARLSERLAAACAAAGRRREDVELLPVTKYFPAGDTAALYRLGLRAFGESREPEASRKVAEFASHIDDPSVRWHMIGRLQRNKVRSVARWAHVVHSVDSLRLADALDSAAQADRSTPLEVFVQVSLDDDPARGGVAAAELSALAERVAAAEHLRLRGLMAIPPLEWEAERAFARLTQLQQQFVRHFPAATDLSAGMSGDLEQAVKYGSTCVRVGTALMGPRPLISQ